jgi:hypothetical protein
VDVPGLDAVLDELAVEFDTNKRVELNHAALRLLLNQHGGGIPHVFEGISNILYWNYYHIGESTHFITTQNVARDSWFDTNDPTYQGRPS